MSITLIKNKNNIYYSKRLLEIPQTLECVTEKITFQANKRLLLQSQTPYFSRLLSWTWKGTPPMLFDISRGFRYPIDPNTSVSILNVPWTFELQHLKVYILSYHSTLINISRLHSADKATHFPPKNNLYSWRNFQRWHSYFSVKSTLYQLKCHMRLMPQKSDAFEFYNSRGLSKWNPFGDCSVRGRIL